jgi:hypothetical protein
VLRRRTGSRKTEDAVAEGREGRGGGAGVDRVHRAAGGGVEDGRTSQLAASAREPGRTRTDMRFTFLYFCSGL